MTYGEEVGRQIDQQIKIAGDARVEAEAEAWRQTVQRLQARETELLAQIEKLKNPDPARMLVGAAYYNNINKPDGVEGAAGVPYDLVRIFAGPNDLPMILSRMQRAADRGQTDVIVSFKLPVSWANAAAGNADSWFRAIAENLSDRAVALKLRVHLAFHHEPENDTAKAEPLAIHMGRAEDWKEMQVRASSFARGLPNLLFGVILMGYYQYKTSEKIHPAWKLDNCVPVEAVDFIYFDLYQEYGNSAHPKGYTNPENGLRVLAAFCEPRKIMFGLAEAGIFRAGFRPGEKGGLFFDPDDATVSLVGLARNLGASVFAYYNTARANVENPDFAKSFAMEPGEPRYNAWVEVVKNKKDLTFEVAP